MKHLVLTLRDYAKSLKAWNLDEAPVLNAAKEIERLESELNTERELRKAAEKNLLDFKHFMDGDPPKTYNLNIKELADRYWKKIHALEARIGGAQ